MKLILLIIAICIGIIFYTYLKFIGVKSTEYNHEKETELLSKKYNKYDEI